jgi:pimeloyl-ACP methyl ester carboxylesterase
MTEVAQGSVRSDSKSAETSLTRLEEPSPMPTHWPVICIGAVAPAAWTYARLQRLLQKEARLVLRDLEGYAQPLAADYGLPSEVKAITCAADAAGFQSFHLVGYSAGGSVALAFALAHPERVNSLTLIEPAWIGNHAWDAVEVAYLSTVDGAMQLPMSQRGHALLMAMSPPGTDPSTIPTPDWLLERSTRFEPIWRSFREATLDIEALQSFPAPVYLPVGGKSHPRFTLAARWLASVFPCSWVDIYQNQTHLEVPPIRETERFIRALQKNGLESLRLERRGVSGD